ncbi:MAG: TPM domain-containing protein [Nitrospinota bacterium]|nr:TPM domain-containing protein [Nitrospinota bacterium]
MIYRNIRSLALISFFICAQQVWAVEFPQKPADTDWYVDMAEMIDANTAQSINKTALPLWVNENVPMYVVTIASLASMGAANYTVEGYATELFNHWGIGSEDRNYGMLLLVSRGDRKARIELGAGWGHEHDSAMQQVMDTLIVPAFKRGDFGLGISDGVRGMDSVARGLALPKPTAPWWFLPLVIVSVIGLIALIYNLFKTGRSGWAWALIVALAIALFFIIRNAGSSSGSGGGFGGGSSGGGGASGSW